MVRLRPKEVEGSLEPVVALIHQRINHGRMVEILLDVSVDLCYATHLGSTLVVDLEFNFPGLAGLVHQDIPEVEGTHEDPEEDPPPYEDIEPPADESGSDQDPDDDPAFKDKEKRSFGKETMPDLANLGVE